jgi:hypothetical protein
MYQRCYLDFIDNKELKVVPGPFEYNINTSRDGVATLSKYKTATMGMASIQAKNDRFKDHSSRTCLI